MESKAKRFGKFNVVDIIAVIVIIAAVVFVGGKLLNRGSSAPVQQDMVKVTYTVRVEGVAKELYENAKKHIPGDLMASGALVGGQVETVEQKPYLVLGPDGQWVEDPDHVNLYFTVTTQTTKSPVMLTKVGDQEVRVGREYILKTEYIEFMGARIIDAEWSE